MKNAFPIARNFRCINWVMYFSFTNTASIHTLAVCVVCVAYYQTNYLPSQIRLVIRYKSCISINSMEPDKCGFLDNVTRNLICSDNSYKWKGKNRMKYTHFSDAVSYAIVLLWLLLLLLSATLSSRSSRLNVIIGKIDREIAG